jgi:maltose alpha-D-glucosyltransferase/alpha-amylase
MIDRNGEDISFKDNPLWYKDAVIYQLHVRSFADSDNDGVGDFQGLTGKLDYLQDLGVTAIWLLPFYPSPLRDDGYDTADYTGVHSMYGTLQDFRTFLEEAHKRDLRVITELIINHTSDQHPWFQRARRSPPGSSLRNFYVWSDTAEEYKETRIIFKDFEFSNWTWDPVARAYYWHRFYSHQPDLNFDNPDVHREVIKVMDFWLGMGVDGLRLDAVPYLYEREGTNCENLPETHAFLKKLRSHVDTHYKDRMLLAEANQWPEDAVTYFGDGDECHMAFHFPLMPRMFVSIRMEDRFPMTETMYQTPAIPEVCQWALFLRNHDELTLEMVTGEERAFMYRTYARDPRARINLGIRRRLAPLLQNDRKQIELLNSLLFSLPGTPVVYYGDEIGMGDNIYLGDRDGVRTPMQWSHELNAGFSRANPQRVFLPVTIDPAYHYEAVNVEAHQANPYSLLRWMKHMIATRKSSRALSRGSLEFLYPENSKVLVFLRKYEDERILVVANLSRFVQCVELNLAAYEGMTPMELFGRTPFPRIGELPYFLTLGPHAVYWFALEYPHQTHTANGAPTEYRVPTLSVGEDWTTIFARSRARTALEQVLPGYLRQRRWFGGKARTIQSVELLETVPVPYESPTAYLTLVQVEYIEGDHETYVLPFTVALGAQARQIAEEIPQVVVAHLRITGFDDAAILYDALRDKEFALLLLDSIAQHRTFRGSAGEVMAAPLRSLRLLSEVSASLHTPATGARAGGGTPAEDHAEAADPSIEFTSTVITSDRSNTTIVYGNQLVLKIFRRIESGINPDLEIGRFLTEKISLVRTPFVAGALEYHQKNSEPMTLGVLRTRDPHQGDAWQYTQGVLAHYFERVLARQGEAGALLLPHKHLLDLADEPAPPLVEELVGDYLATARLLGQRTAEFHVALAQETEDLNFVPEPFTDFFQRPFYHAMLGLMARDFQFLNQQLEHLPEAVRNDAYRIKALEPEVRRYFEPFRDRKITAMRIRCHGNYHLGQVLRADNDFMITDFEGEPARSLDERRTKVSPLRDVASMIRSFHYAVYVALFEQRNSGRIGGVDQATQDSWARFWYVWVAATFLRAYSDTIHLSPLLLQTREEFKVLLDAYLLEKALYELGYELNSRPDWVVIPLQGILQLLEHRVE